MFRVMMFMKSFSIIFFFSLLPINNQLTRFCSFVHIVQLSIQIDRRFISQFILTRKRFATRVIMERYESTNFIFIFFYETQMKPILRIIKYVLIATKDIN